MDLRYPIGQFQYAGALDADERASRISAIGALPVELSEAVAGLTDDQLDTRYRPAGWTLRQVVHHIADSHANAHARIRLALTEENPTVRPYDEVAWATLPDAMIGPVEPSLSVIRGLHERLHSMLLSLPESDFARPFVHPEAGEWTLDWLLDMYAWHGRHHVAHITTTRERLGW